MRCPGEAPRNEHALCQVYLINKNKMLYFSILNKRGIRGSAFTHFLPLFYLMDTLTCLNITLFFVPSAQIKPELAGPDLWNGNTGFSFFSALSYPIRSPPPEFSTSYTHLVPPPCTGKVQPTARVALFLCEPLHHAHSSEQPPTLQGLRILHFS